MCKSAIVTAAVKTVWVMVLVSCGSTNAFADVASCKANFTAQNVMPERSQVRINGNSGRVAGSTRFPDGELVQLLIEGKNPFKYRYRVDVTSTPLAESTASRFFSLVGLDLIGRPLPPASASAPPPPPPAPPGDLAAVPAASVCVGNDEGLAKALETANMTARGARDDLKALLDTQIGISKAYDAFVAATEGDTLASNSVCDDAARLSTQLDGLIDLGQTPARLKAYTSAVQQLRQAQTAFVAFGRLADCCGSPD